LYTAMDTARVDGCMEILLTVVMECYGAERENVQCRFKVKTFGVVVWLCNLDIFASSM
jgi:hypothetical protein